MSKNIHIFTHTDLDGAGSLLTLIWAFPDDNVTFTTVNSAHTFRDVVTATFKQKPIEAYDKVFVVDLSIHKEDIPLIDKKNVVFIDHHKTSLELQFNNAASFIKLYSSCTLFIYKIFKTALSLTAAQKQLIVHIDDYDSYALKFSITRDLNYLFWAHYVSSITSFIKDFIDGLQNFTELQKNIIYSHKQKIATAIQQLQIFKLHTNIQQLPCIVIAAFADTAINDIADFLLTRFIADVVVVINLKTSRVSFRRKKDSQVDVSILAKSLCDGGGHEAAAGGALTEKFLNFSKLFEPV